jgi:hypothetical protein
MKVHANHKDEWLLTRKSYKDIPMRIKLLRVISRILITSFLPILLVGLGIFSFNQLSAGGPTTALAAGLPVIAAAGSIACDPLDPHYNGGNGDATHCQQKATSDLLTSMANLTGVLPLGDNQQECGSLSAYNQSYDPTWGRVKSMTHPAVGDHEYLTATVNPSTGCTSANAGAAGYFGYFGVAAGNPISGYYSYNIAQWHIVVLNSNCSKIGGCSPLQPQAKWLESDLAANNKDCTLAYWHQPLFSSGGHPSANVKTYWDILYAHGADVILNGHDRDYERFAPQTPNGVPNPTQGIREFVVGTGGDSHGTISTTLTANSEVTNDDTFGVLKLTLHNKSYDWAFVPAAGGSFTDIGSTNCSTGGGGFNVFLPLILK